MCATDRCVEAVSAALKPDSRSQSAPSRRVAVRLMDRQDVQGGGIEAGWSVLPRLLEHEVLLQGECGVAHAATTSHVATTLTG